MTRITTIVTYLLMSTAIALQPAGAQSPAPAPALGPTTPAPSPVPDCMTALIDMADCLNFVDVGSNLTRPDSQCCPEVVDMISNHPICLCQLLSNSSQFGISIDVNRALELPPLCNISAPPVKFCAAIGIPVADLAPSPSAAKEDNGSPTNLLPINQIFLVALALALSIPLF